MRLEDRCEALESSFREESDTAKAEAGRAKAAEERFARLLVWAREEEERRLQTEEKLRRVCEVGKALDDRRKALKEEVRRGGGGQDRSSQKMSSTFMISIQLICRVHSPCV